jgi:hypothetical protein
MGGVSAEGQEEGAQVPWGGEPGVRVGPRRGLKQCSVFGRDIWRDQELAHAGKEAGREATTV